MKRIIANILTVLLSILLLIAGMEITLRAYQLVKYRRPMFFSIKGQAQPIYIDKKIGWRSTENYYYNGERRDASGEKYHVKNTTNSYGFRSFGDPNTNKRKILFIGDSFTEAENISNGKTFYGILASKLLKIACYAYGTGGFGSLQEFMIIDEYIDIIKPQLLILQLCSNDFINNDYLLELKSYENNNGRTRPYLDEKGNIFYKNPRHFASLPEIIMDYSRIVSIADNAVKILLGEMNRGRTIEREIEREGDSHNGFRHSAEITKRVFDKIKARAKGIPIITFCVDDTQPYYNEFRKIAVLEGFVFIDGIPQAIRAYEQKGFVTRYVDRKHWNELGHKIAAEKIYEYLSNNKVNSKMDDEMTGAIQK